MKMSSLHNMRRFCVLLKHCVPASLNQRLFSSVPWNSCLNKTALLKYFPCRSPKSIRGITTSLYHDKPCLVQEFAPDFTATAVFPDDSMKPLTLSCYRGQYVILLFYPLDFTFVCPTEILAFNKHVKDFQERQTQIIGISVDSHFCHRAWRSLPISQGGISKIEFPLVSDLSKTIAQNYHVLTKDRSMSFRALFLIDREGIIRHSVINDLPLGRHVNEVLRVLDALQHVENTGDVCPGNWSKGEQSIKPTNEGILSYLKTLGSGQQNQ